MPDVRFPDLTGESLHATRDALHAYARVIGAWAASSRKQRKHWWHASLRPSLRGMTTGFVAGEVGFELELDLVESAVHVRTVGDTRSIPLSGQTAAALGDDVFVTLTAAGVDPKRAAGEKVLTDVAYDGYSATVASDLLGALSSVTAALEDFRAGVREETSPIQVWPHHFDLSMLWLPGARIAEYDPADEENADKQMNFGFVFGDATIDEPYLYVTAYPLPAALPSYGLPEGTRWQSDGFQGAVLLYKNLIATDDPHAYLVDLWSGLLEEGRKSLSLQSSR